GVPHLVIEVPKVSEVPLGEWGGALRRHPAFAPAGTNVDFIERRSSAGARLAMRTYERGVEGETLACGSGAIASALSRAGSGLADATIETAGGDELQVRWRENGEG